MFIISSMSSVDCLEKGNLLGLRAFNNNTMPGSLSNLLSPNNFLQSYWLRFMIILVEDEISFILEKISL